MLALELISHQAQQSPDAVALQDEEQSLTYAQLDQQSSKCAATLGAKGVAAESLVGLAMQPTADRVVAMLGILKAGGAYLPLDPSYPLPRQAEMLADASPQLVVVDRATCFTVPDAHPTIAYEELRTYDSRVDLNAPIKPAPSNLAYVIYTSGSTGRPKGVLLEHQGLADMATFHARQFQLGPGCHFLQFASVCFDASVLEIFTTLISGATLHLAPAEHRQPGPQLVATLRDRKISHVLLPPSTLEILPSDDLPDLKTLISGGEPCTEQLVHRWATGRRLINAYGPTECTVTATTWTCEANATGDPPIGTPCDQTQVYILDKSLLPVPQGEAGELYLGGTGLARGYLNRPQLTEECFVLVTIEGTNQRLYKTGDLVRQRSDGAILFLGRKDRQVKVRGYRIELGEVESLILKHPDVAAVEVRTEATSKSHCQLIAHVTMHEASTFSESQIRDWLSSRVPQHVVPARFVYANCSASQGAPPKLVSAATRPSAKTKQLIAIWESVLGVEPIAATDHFIELGGDSLLSARIAAAATAAGLPLTPQDVLSYPTIEELVALLQDDRPC